jgi:hypothetical protein
LSSLVYPLSLLRKHISAASRPVMSRVVVTHVSLPYSSVGLPTTLQNFILDICTGFLQMFSDGAPYSLESVYFVYQSLVHRLNSVRITNN